MHSKSHPDQLLAGETCGVFMLREGMVLCSESYMGVTGEREGVKLEQQVLIPADGYEMLTAYSPEESLLN